MKKILVTVMAFVLTIGAQAQQDSIDQCQFVVVYDYVTNTTDRNGNAVKDSVQLAVMVGSHATKCMEYNRTMLEDFGEWQNRGYQYGEWDARKYNLPVMFVGYPDGEVSSFDKVVPNRYFYTEPLPDFGWQLMDDTLTVSGYTTLKRDKFIAHRNKLFCNKQYVQKPNYYIPQGTYEHLNIIEMWPGGPEPPAEDKISVVATDMIIPKKANKYQPLELK